MPFPKSVRETALVKAHRRCCVCHEFGGRSVNVHHIIPESQDGPNTLDNAIVLCLRCHAEAGHFNPNHPLGTKYSPNELIRHRDEWYRHCESNPNEPIGPHIELGFRREFTSQEIHKYRITAKYRNTYEFAHEGWKIEIFIPSEIPSDHTDFDRYDDINVNGALYTMYESESTDRIYPGQEINLLEGNFPFYVEYEINNEIYWSKNTQQKKILLKFYTSNAPIVEDVRMVKEMHEF